MDRRTVTIAVIAALATVAIGITAATLSSTVSPGTSGGGDGPGGPENGGVPIEDPPEQDESEGEFPPFLERLLAVIMLLALLGAVVYLLAYRREAAVLLGKLLVVILVVWVLVRLLGTVQIEIGEFGFAGQGEGFGFGQGESDGKSGTVSTSAILLVGGGMLLVVLGVLAVLDSGSGSDDDNPGRTEDGTEELARIAGRAADRIEGDGSEAIAENEVYRAWQEMTSSLEVENEETTTPREFRRVAVDAGMRPDDVDELTRLFELVRYGGKEPTADRERRALEVLRRIESKYGEDE